MARFEPALEVVLAHEVGAAPDGGFVDDAQDPGGATKWGISLRYLERLEDLDSDGWLDGDLDHDGDVDPDDVRLLDRDRASAIYRAQWWQRYGYGALRHQPIATKVMDLAVNMGAGRAHQLLQHALHAVHKFEVAADGVLGPITRTAANDTDPWQLLPALRSEAAGYYRLLVARRPDLGIYKKGWLKRAYS